MHFPSFKKLACFTMRVPVEPMEYTDMLEIYKGKRVLVKMKQDKYKYEGVLISEQKYCNIHLEDVKKISRKKVIDELDEVIISPSNTVYISPVMKSTIAGNATKKSFMK